MEKNTKYTTIKTLPFIYKKTFLAHKLSCNSLTNVKSRNVFNFISSHFMYKLSVFVLSLWSIVSFCQHMIYHLSFRTFYFCQILNICKTVILPCMWYRNTIFRHQSPCLYDYWTVLHIWSWFVHWSSVFKPCFRRLYSCTCVQEEL